MAHHRHLAVLSHTYFVYPLTNAIFLRPKERPMNSARLPALWSGRPGKAYSGTGFEILLAGERNVRSILIPFVLQVR